MTDKLSTRTGRSVALCLLSWKSDVTLENTLADHRARGVFAPFDRSVIHFQEIRGVDVERARRFGVEHLGSPVNRHIGGGFYKLVREVEADYLFLLEDDLTFAVDAEALVATLADAIAVMERGEMDEFLCRRDDMVRSGYEKYFAVREFDAAHNPPDAGLRARGALGRGVRRLLHPAQADKHLGKVVWFERAPEQVRPDVVTRIHQGAHDFYVVRGRATKWANPALLASRRHLLEVYDHVAAHTPGFAEFGKSLEGLINDGPFRAWWLAQGYRIGFTKPVLTLHDRLGDGGKIGLRSAS